ncbi:undecaprenyl-diphosphatase [Rhodoferax sp.]|uniref:undecaprenyl-diphosphatase n=1 Tax=Rhodoferax sp. TaxID=50421 RepID=UPI0026300465|nr:undecaprenyl-diphosphatase [Rhodoferax sp.]MDD2811227.1 undecaprenyl-diphosphatase [Rhodoferax sp.]
MQELNETLFLLINAPVTPNAIVLAVAKVLADQAIWLAPMALIIGWFRGSERTRKLMLEATASGLAGLLINQVIGLFWQHPRPFMVGLGNTFIPHVADSSFPSDHLTLLWSIAFSFLMHQRPRFAGVVLALLGLPVAWARIYLGVHFPMDMVGAALVAVSCAYLCFREERWFLDSVYRWTSAIYRQLFALPIRRGWVRP